MTAATDELLYLYCVLEPGTPAQRLLDTRQVPGLDPTEPLQAVQAAGLVAAVSRVPGAVFEEEPLNVLLTDLPRLAPLAVRHEEAIRALLPAAPALVPLNFGAVYHDERRVADLLTERAADFRSLLDRLRGNEEWGLKVYRDPSRLAAAAERASPELQRLAAEATAASPGRAYLLTKRAEQVRASEVVRLTHESVATIHERLAARSRGARAEPLAMEPVGALQLVGKAAYLVPAEKVAEFRAEAEAVEADYAPFGLQLEISGPWAAYSFVAESRG